MKLKVLIAGATLALVSALAAGVLLAASEQAPAKPVFSHGQALVDRLQQLRPGLPVESVTKTPVAGLVALNLTDGETYYGTEDGRYLFSGDLFRLDDNDLVNLSEERRSGQRKTLLASIETKDTVVFAPNKQAKASLYVFTDVDCGYCRKLHQEVPALNAMGIEVRYLAYPRAGVGSPSYDKIVSAWCARDPQAALTNLKAGQNIKTQTCTNPVANQYDLGRQMGINGTPAIVLEDGTLLPGYMPAAQLAAALGL
ncbi:MAG: DsbC family protein [Pseudomonadales bacterium]